MLQRAVKAAAALLTALGALMVTPSLGPMAASSTAARTAPGGTSQSMQGDGIQASAAATVKVFAAACGGTHLGSAFAVSPNQILTNAHVVGGATRVWIETPQGGHATATVTLFDPGRDVAILSVREITFRPVPLGAGSEPEIGVAIGYPAGGPETISSGTVEPVTRLAVPDIYGQHPTPREVWVTNAQLAHGSSGGPLLDARGRLIGVVFAGSANQPTVSYALTNREIGPDLLGLQAHTQAVSTGPCAG